MLEAADRKPNYTIHSQTNSIQSSNPLLTKTLLSRIFNQSLLMATPRSKEARYKVLPKYLNPSRKSSSLHFWDFFLTVHFYFPLKVGFFI
jgi:hypothetical protein